MAQNLDASVSIPMFLSFCMTVLNSSGWNIFLTSCPLCLFEELLLCVQCNCLIFWYCFCWTVKSDSDCRLILPVHKVSFLSHFFVSGLDLLCHFVVSYHPFSQQSRETDNVFQSLKFNQPVSHGFGNFSYMVVAEIVVIASVNYSNWHNLEGLLLLLLPRSITLEWLALCWWLMSVYAQKSSACEWLVHVLVSLCPGCRFTMAQWFYQTFVTITLARWLLSSHICCCSKI